MCLLGYKLFRGNQKPIFYLISFLILVVAYIIAGQPSASTCSATGWFIAQTKRLLFENYNKRMRLETVLRWQY